MNLIVKRHFSNGQSASIPLSGKGLKITAAAGERYQLVDAATGKFPAKALVKKVGNHLVVDVDGQEAVMELTDFYTGCPADSACALEIVESGAELVASITPATEPGMQLSDDVYSLYDGALRDGLAQASDMPDGTSGSLPGKFFPAFAASGLGLGVLGGGSAAVSESLIAGAVVAGPMNAGITVIAYDKNGKELGRAPLAADGSYSIKVKGYTGPVLLKAVDENGAAGNYESETTGAQTDLPGELRALATVDKSGVIVNVSITPLTELAARKLGVTSDNKASASAASIAGMNKAIGALFGVDDILANPLAVNHAGFNAADGVTPAEKYGVALAALSGADALMANGLDGTLEQLARAIAVSSGGVASMAPEGQELMAKGLDAFRDGASGYFSKVGTDVLQSVIKTAIVVQAPQVETFENVAEGDNGGWTGGKVISGGASFSNFLTSAKGHDSPSATPAALGLRDPAGPDVYKTFALSGKQTSVTISFSFYEIDSWDNERLFVWVNGVKEAVASAYRYGHRDNERSTDGTTGVSSDSNHARLGFNGSWDDELHTYTLTVNTTGTSLTLGFSANLNEAWNDEAWGVDNVVIRENASSVAVALAQSGTGNDAWTGTSANDNATGGVGNDSMSGGAGSDVLSGGDGDDVLAGGEGNDVLNGGRGNDKLTGGAGNDMLIGGGGANTAIFSGNRAEYTIVYDAASQAYTVADLRAGSPDGTDSAHGIGVFQFKDTAVTTQDEFAAPLVETFENVAEGGGGGWTGGKVISGGASFSNFLTSAKGHDSPSATPAALGLRDPASPDVYKTFALSGKQSSVTISFSFYEIDSWDNERLFVWVNGVKEAVASAYKYGHRDNERSTDGATGVSSDSNHADLGFNGSWDDELHTYTLTVNTTDTSLTLGFSANLDESWSNEAWGVDNVVIRENASSVAVALTQNGTGNDSWSGSAANDNATGGVGNDSMNGGAGSDILSGGDGDDMLGGGDGDDVLNGGRGNDKLSGGAGDDVLIGGGGSDRYDGGAGDDIIAIEQEDLAADGSIDGGTGIDTLAIGSGGTTLNLSTTPGIGHIERIDLTESRNNALLLSASDVQRLSAKNLFNSANGWLGLDSSVDRYQMVIDGGVASRLGNSGWSKTGLSVTNNGQAYTVYEASNGAEAVQLLVDADIVLAPMVTIKSSRAALAGGETATITFTFSDVPAGFTSSDIAATNGMIGDLAATGDPKVYTATFTQSPVLSVEATIVSVAADSYENAQGIRGIAGVSEPISRISIAPVAQGDTGTAVESGWDGGRNATGNVLDNDTDVDIGDTKTVAALTYGTISGAVGKALAGSYGNLKLNADGSYSYAANNENPIVNALRTASDTLIDTFTYTVQDTAGGTSTTALIITIRGTNDRPKAVDDLGSIGVGNVLFNDIDVDAGDTKMVSLNGGASSVQMSGYYGSLMLDVNGTYSYALNRTDLSVGSDSDPLVDTFTYTMRDATGASSTATLSINILENNDAPVAMADTDVAKETGMASGSNASGNVLVNDTDADSGDSKSVSALAGGALGAAKTGSYGSLTLNADGSYSYAVDNGNASVNALRATSTTLTDTFTYTMRDAAGAASTAALKISIHGANDSPTAVADIGVAKEAGMASGSNASGNVLVNDADADNGDSMTVSALASGTLGVAKAGSYGSLTLNADGTYTYAVDNDNTTVNALRTADDTLIDIFTYTVRDAAGATSTATLAITIQGANDAPALIVPITDQPVTISSPFNNLNVARNLSDMDIGDTLIYSLAPGAPAWLSINAATGTISGRPTDKGAYDITVIATDAAGATASDTFSFFVGDIIGTPGDDTLHVSAGTSIDFIWAGTGTDKLYLTGLMSDYSQSNVDNVYTLTRIAGLSAGQIEVIRFISHFEDDYLYFADGYINLNVEAMQPSGSPLLDPYTGEFRPLSFSDLINDAMPQLLANQSIDNVANLDVDSAIVLTFGQNIALGSGQIRIMDDMGTNGWTVDNPTTGESKQDVTDNDVILTLTNGVVTGFTVGGMDKSASMAGSVTVDGNRLIINPSGDHSAFGNTAWNFDWDFGANYHIALDAGVVKGSGGNGNAAVTDTTALNFTTVTPVANVTGAASQKMNTSSGALQSGYTWHSAHTGSDDQLTGYAMDFSGGAHALVIQTNGGTTWTTTIGGKVTLSNFGVEGGVITSDDLLYNDNLGDMNMATTDGVNAGQWTLGNERYLFNTAGTPLSLNQRVIFDTSSFPGWTSALQDNLSDGFEHSTRYNANVIIFG